MASIRVHRRILRWGNGYGVRLTKADLEQLQLAPGTEAHVTVESRPSRIDLSHIQWLHDDADVGARHDELLGEAADAGH